MSKVYIHSLENHGINAGEEKAKDVLDNFLKNLGIIKKYLEDTSRTDIKIIGTMK